MKDAASAQPFPKQAFHYLATAERRHWWFRARNQIIIWILKSKAHGIQSFLEVGCGTGNVISSISEGLPGLELEASEYFEEGLLFARRRVPQCNFRQLDATAMTELEAYDCIGAFDVIEHIDRDTCVLANFHRALRRGGVMLLTVPQHPWLWSEADGYAKHVRRYTRRELQGKVLKAGFKISYCTSFVSLLLPLMALQRLTAGQQNYNPEAEFKINRLVNTALYMVMQIEFTLLRLGLRFPAGGSLLLVGHKP